MCLEGRGTEVVGSPGSREASGSVMRLDPAGPRQSARPTLSVAHYGDGPRAAQPVPTPSGEIAKLK